MTIDSTNPQLDKQKRRQVRLEQLEKRQKGLISN